MALPTLVKTWTHSVNNRITFVSLNDTTARLLFGIKNFLVATMGYTVKYTCNGVTGPTSAADNTDRWISFSNASTRGTSAATAQSFAVLTDSNPGAFATGTLTTTANFANGETVTTGTKTYTFQTVLTNVNGNVLIGATAQASLLNLASAINLGPGAGALYANSTTANTFVSGAPGVSTLVLTSLTAGTVGNATATTETATNASFANATLTGGSGMDILLTYQGASDDIARISFSPTGLFTPAGTANQQPTATDEIVVVSALTLINATASLDRVWHAQASTDKKQFRVNIYRNSVLTYQFGVEQVTREPNMGASFVWPSNAVGWGTFAVSPASQGSAYASFGVGQQAQARVNATTVPYGGIGESQGWNNVTVAQPELQAFTPITPIGYYNNTSSALQGILGYPIDMWGCPVGGNIGQGDTFGSLGFIYLGSRVLPWDGVTTPQIA